MSRHLVSDLESGKATGISLARLVRVLGALGMNLHASVGVAVAPRDGQRYPSQVQDHADTIAAQLKGTRHVFG